MSDNDCHATKKSNQNQIHLIIPVQYDLFHARENEEPVSRFGNHLVGEKRKITCNHSV